MTLSLIKVTKEASGRFKFKFETKSATIIVGDRLNRRYRLYDKEGNESLPFISSSEHAKILITKDNIDINEFQGEILFQFPGTFQFEIDQDCYPAIYYNLKKRQSN